MFRHRFLWLCFDFHIARASAPLETIWKRSERINSHQTILVKWISLGVTQGENQIMVHTHWPLSVSPQHVVPNERSIEGHAEQCTVRYECFFFFRFWIMANVNLNVAHLRYKAHQLVFLKKIMTQVQ